MNPDKSLISIPTRKNPKRIIVAIAACVIIAVFLYTLFFELTFTNEIMLLVFVSLIGLALFGIETLIHRVEYQFSKESVIRKKRFSQQVYPIDLIRGYKESQYSSGKQQGRRLLLLTPKGYLKLHSHEYVNYKKIVQFAQKRFKALRKVHFSDSASRKNVLAMRIMFTAFAVLLIGFYGDSHFENSANLKKDIQYINLTLSENPEKKYITGGWRTSHVSRDYIQLHTHEFPKLEFRIQDYAYLECSPSILEDLNAGDNVIIGITSIDLESRIQQTRPLPVISKYLNSHIISVYQVAHESKMYIFLDRVDKHYTNGTHISWFYLLSGVFFLYMAIKKDYSNGLY